MAATAIALFGPGPGATLATVVGALVEGPVMLSVCGVCSRMRHRFADSEAQREGAAPAARGEHYARGMMDRRGFVMSVGGAGLEKPVEADVLVVGGGTAGAIAAIQAGRLGAKTVLVEAGPQLGGTMTTGGVDYPGLFYAWGRQVIAGIGWELVKATVELNGDRLPDFSLPYGRAHWRHQVRMNGGLYAVLAEDACVRAGVGLRYYETALGVERGRDGWRVRVAGKGGERVIRARQVVDATGDAAVVGLAGLARRREEETQPGTLMYKLRGYHLEDLDFAALEEKARQAVAAGELDSFDFRHNLRAWLQNYGNNAMHVPGADSSTSEAHTRTNVRGRQSLLRMMRFLRGTPGFEELKLERLPAETGVRETYRIVGETTVTVEDYRNGRRFEDAVAYSFYPIDLHGAEGVTPKQLKEGTVAAIPLGALVPRGSRDLLVAGRAVSSDRLANSALRVQASSMAMGQVAGVAAALGVQMKGTPGRLPLERVRETLRRQGAVVPE